MTNRTNKLDQLTSLRFFAAFMIVIHHSVGLFGISDIGNSLDHGVSFFYVLSGFILAYVYPKLETWLDVKKFLRARIARIWPAYIFSLFVGFWLIHYKLDVATLAVYVLMVQAWIPLEAYYFSYNAVAWSVSTEFFFYLAFPFLIHKWNNTWLLKLLCSGAILMALMVLIKFLSLPYYIESNKLAFTQHGLLYINPLSRVLEFVFGMCITLAWRRMNVKWTTSKATTYEFCSIIFCAISMHYIPLLKSWSAFSVLGAAEITWLVHCGSMFAFGLLIYTMAHGRGKISAALTHPFLVVLGEISFSLYLIHLIILFYYRQNLLAFSHLSNPLAFCVFIGVSLLSSYLMWAFVEMPGRRLIVGHQKIHGTSTMRKSWQNHLVTSWKPILAGVTLSCVIGLLYSMAGNLDAINKNDAENITPAAFKNYIGTDFGNLFTLRGLEVKCDVKDLNIKLAWESLVAQKLSRTVAVHFVNDAGEIIVQADYKQSFKNQNVEQGSVWLDTILIPEGKLNGDIKKMAIGLYSAENTMLRINQNNTDWDGRRLIIPINVCAGKV